VTVIITLGTTPTVQRTMTFDRLVIDGVNRATAVRQFASGKSVNAARVLHTLGESVVTSGIVGGDAGAFMRTDLDAAGIAHEFVDTTPVETRLCLTIVDESAGTATELVEESRAPDPAVFSELLETLSELLARTQSDVLVLSGTLAPGAGDDYYARCLRLAHRAGAQTVLDARGAPLKRALAERPTVVKPNRTELSATVGAPVDSDDALRDAIRAVVSMGAGWAVVTNGPHDTIVSDGSRFWRVGPPEIDAVNPIGSGDSFAAGLAAALRGGHEVPQATMLATACAAANALTPDAGHVRNEDVSRLAAQIRVESLG
jgi:tagatose 6-phosphate kinase